MAIIIESHRRKWRIMAMAKICISKIGGVMAIISAKIIAKGNENGGGGDVSGIIAEKRADGNAMVTIVKNAAYQQKRAAHGQYSGEMAASAYRRMKRMAWRKWAMAKIINNPAAKMASA
jgi:hypothetical protein